MTAIPDCRACPPDCRECSRDIDCECYTHEDPGPDDAGPGSSRPAREAQESATSATLAAERGPDVRGEGSATSDAPGGAEGYAPEEAYAAAFDAAFPGLPAGIPIDQARRRVHAAVDAVWALAEQTWVPVDMELTATASALNQARADLESADAELDQARARIAQLERTVANQLDRCRCEPEDSPAAGAPESVHRAAREAAWNALARPGGGTTSEAVRAATDAVWTIATQGRRELAALLATTPTNPGDGGTPDDPDEIAARLRSWTHDYLSTACLHEAHTTDPDERERFHAYCAGHVGQVGAKTPARCKWCEARCGCKGHSEEER